MLEGPFDDIGARKQEKRDSHFVRGSLGELENVVVHEHILKSWFNWRVVDRF